MSERPFLRFLTAAALVTAAAAACAFLIAWSPVYPGGWGVPIAKWSEVWSQRLLPGGWPVEFAEPSWKTEEYLGSSGVVRYEGRPHGSIHVCVPYAVFSLGVGVAATLLHFAVCWGIVHLRRREVSATSLALRSAAAASCVALLACVVYWAWAGADRGSLSQRVVGGQFVGVFFGPFGRLTVLLGAALMYLAVMAWFARERPAEGSPTRRKPRLAMVLAAASIVCLAFPYWGAQSLRLVSQSTAIRIGKWSEETPLRKVAEQIAPLP